MPTIATIFNILGIIIIVKEILRISLVRGISIEINTGVAQPTTVYFSKFLYITYMAVSVGKITGLSG